MNYLIAGIPWQMHIMIWMFAIVSVVLILVVLIQKGRGGGLGAAFGGGANSLLGTKTGDFLTWVTIGVVAIFLFLGIAMAKFSKTMDEGPAAGAGPTSGAPQNSEGETSGTTVDTPKEGQEPEGTKTPEDTATPESTEQPGAQPEAKPADGSTTEEPTADKTQDNPAPANPQ